MKKLADDNFERTDITFHSVINTKHQFKDVSNIRVHSPNAILFLDDNGDEQCFMLRNLISYSIHKTIIDIMKKIYRKLFLKKK